MIEAVHVVIPARNEQELLPHSLTSVRAATRSLRRQRPDLLIDVTVVLDGCTDGSAELAHRARVGTLVVDLGVVGAVRDAGVRRALAVAHGLGVDSDAVWIASTDADTVVGTRWLTRQVELAATHDLVIGTVEPHGLSDPTHLARWRARHALVEGHHHVHGANLGFRGSAYVAVGGFRPLVLDEDVDLVTRLRDHSAGWTATDTIRVATSSRRDSRVAGGFADYVAALQDEVG